MGSIVVETVATTLSWCVIPTTPLATHGVIHDVGFQRGLERLTDVLAAPDPSDAAAPRLVSVGATPLSARRSAACDRACPLRRPPSLRSGFRSRAVVARSRHAGVTVPSAHGVPTVVPAPWSVPTAAALTQFRTVCPTNPSSLAHTPAVKPSWTRVTANALNSVVYSRIGICIVHSFMVSASIRNQLEDEVL